MSLNEQNEKPLKEAVELAMMNCYMQVQGIDVAYPYIAGAPGGGKTWSIGDLCRKSKWGLISTHFPLKPYEETGGIPQFNEVTVNGEKCLGTTWSFPDVMGEMYKLAEQYKDTQVVWLLEDMHLCGAVHMGLLYELLTERKLREYHLPKNVSIVLLGNHGSNKAGAKTVFSAIINRIFMMPTFSSFEDWKMDFAIPNNIHKAIVSWLQNEQNEQFFHEEEQVDTPWCSPRAWTRLSNYMQNYEHWFDKPMEEDKLLYLAAGHVSKTAASNFTTYYKIFSKFNIEEDLKNANNFQIPQDPINRYAFAFALLSHMTGAKDRKNQIPNFAKLVYKYLKDHQDLGLMIMHEIINIAKVTKNNNFYLNTAKELNTIENGITRRLLDDVINV